MRCQWHFRNEVQETFSKILFIDDLDEPWQSNFSAEEWKALRKIASDRIIVIKFTDKGSLVVVWDRADYILEAEKRLHDKRVYKEVKFNENILTGLVEKSNKILNPLCSYRLISESELKYFTYNFKKRTNIGKFYFLPKYTKGQLMYHREDQLL